MKRIINILTIIFVLIVLPSVILAADGTTDDFEDGKTTNLVAPEYYADDLEDPEILIIDEYTRETSNKYFDLTLERGDQTPFGRSIPYVLTVTPHIDSTRTQILWNLPLTIEVRPNHPQFVSMTRGETYTFEARIKPLKEGVYDFSVSVISWQHDTNYTNAINDTVVFDSNLVLQPVSDHYRLLNTLIYVGIGLAFVLLFVGGYFAIKNILPRVKKWLTPPQF